MTDTQTPRPLAYEENEIGLLDILVTLAESWKLLVFGPLVVGALSGGLSFLWPSSYESVSIVRLSEEEIALTYTAPVLDQIISNLDLLKDVNGSQADVRSSLKSKLFISVDKKTKLATLVAKGSTPEQAQALGVAAIEAVLHEQRPKGKEEEAMLKTIRINERFIGIAEDMLERMQISLKANTKEYLEQGATIKNVSLLNSEIAARAAVNIDLAKKLEVRGEEVYAQKASLPERRAAPKRSVVVMIAVLASGFALLLWVYMSNAWQQASKVPDSAEKIKRIKAAIGR